MTTDTQTEPPPIDPAILQWDKDNLEDSLQQVYQLAVNQTNDQIGYYRDQSRPKKRWARWLRALAIVFTALGGIIPMFSQLSISQQPGFGFDDLLQPVWASVAVALAATFLGLDRFFGFSTAWMRFISSELELQGKLREFQYDWAYQKLQGQGQPPSYEQAQAMMLRSATFANDVSLIVQEETRSWMEEFQSVIKKLDDSAKAQAQTTEVTALEQMEAQTVAAKPGAIALTVSNGDQCAEGWALIVDDDAPRMCSGTSGAVSNLLPGIHKITLKGKLGGKLVFAETVTNVAPGAIGEINLTLS